MRVRTVDLWFGVASATASLLIALAIGCDERPRAPYVPPPLPAVAPPAAPVDLKTLPATQPSPPRANYVVGRIFTTDGQLLRKAGIRVEVEIKGLLQATSEQVTITFNAEADGTYAKKLEPGLYYPPSARIEFTFEGGNYRLPLVPVYGRAGDAAIAPGDAAMRFVRRATGMRIAPFLETRPDRIPRHSAYGMGSVQESSIGVAQDFVWRLNGMRPGPLKDEERPESWIGGCLYPDYVSFRPDIKRNVPAAPLGTRVFFVFTPIGGKPDDSLGELVVAERRFEGAGTSLYHPFIHDVPLERFTITGFEILPDGKRKPLLFLKPDSKWGDSMQGTFPANLRTSTLEPLRFLFTRSETTE